MFKKSFIILSIASFVFVAHIAVVGAQVDLNEPKKGVDKLQYQLGQFGDNTGLGKKGETVDIKLKIAGIINIALGFIGLLAVSMIIFAGFKWMTAGGNEDQISDARGHIKNAVIGIAVVMLSYVIVSFVVSQVSDVTSGNGGGGAQDGGQVVAPN